MSIRNLKLEEVIFDNSSGFKLNLLNRGGN